jgi:hypothetical protein
MKPLFNVSMNTVPAVLFEITPSDALQNPINPFYDLYKYYIDLVIRFNIYYFAILGALVTYLAANDDANRIQPLLIVPFVLSLCQTFTYFISRKLANEIHAEKVSYLRKINSQNLAKSTTEIKTVARKKTSMEKKTLMREMSLTRKRSSMTKKASTGWLTSSIRLVLFYGILL